MTETVEFLNFWLAIGTVALLGASVVLLADVFFYRKKYFGAYITEYGMHAATVLAAGASLLTIIYSDVFGFLPCWLCWWQRVFLYPQVLLLATAYFIKDKSVALYGMVLSIPGLIIALYQHYIQMGGTELVGCPSGGGDCAQRFVFEFGFVTFPLMAAALFLFLISIYLYLYKRA
jgi:disulfide bond formation protein DsbB